MKIAYFDCFAGAGGDMIAASLIDAGLDREFLAAQLNTLGIEGLKVEIEPDKQSCIAALTFHPIAPQQKTHRHLSDITEMIKESGISSTAKENAVAIFKLLGHAEAAVHGKELNEVHFHEVGAVDSIVDIVTVSIAIDALKIDKVICSPFSVGGGTIKIAHGVMPAPAPATVEILKQAKAPIAGGPVCAELLTPTAAAILTYFADDFAPLPPMTIDKIGYGAGSMKFESLSNILRVIIGESVRQENAQTDSICLLEANIDDVTGENIGCVTEKLLSHGALDVYTTPIMMKKGRPAVKLSVIATHAKALELENILFDEQITFGIRKQILQRSILKRSFVTVETRFGQVKIKTGTRDAEIIIAKPEFSDCSEAAKRHNVPLKRVEQEALKAFKLLESG